MGKGSSNHNERTSLSAVSNQQVLYHGTSLLRYKKILVVGLEGTAQNGIFVTDNINAARQYAELTAHADRSIIVTLAVQLPAFAWQPNGTVAPPFFADDWHTDSGMPGEAWEYDARVIYPTSLCLYQ